MRIFRNEEYKFELQNILRYIANDKIGASRGFKKELDREIRDIPNFPYKYRKSIYFDDENIRDMIFRGYTVNYKIDLDKDIVYILSIFNQNKPS